MTVAFRVDASLDMGTGHVMRCLTLADVLRGRGRSSLFVTRARPGGMADIIAGRGHPVVVMPPPPDLAGGPGGWLGLPEADDAAAFLAALGYRSPTTVVVDHYGIGATWENVVRAAALRVVAIDDLGDRDHACDLLVDPMLGRRAADLAGRAPAGTPVLAGARHAILRPAFADRRAEVMAREPSPPPYRVLVTMGGHDRDGVTGRVLSALAPMRSEIARCTVLLGRGAPHVDAVGALARRLPFPTDLRIGVDDVAGLMAASDIAIGAGGTTSWERCCLGLPTLVTAVADNQIGVIAALSDRGAAIDLGPPDGLAAAIPEAFVRLRRPGAREALRRAAFAVTDGRGAERVADALEAIDPASPRQRPTRPQSARPALGARSPTDGSPQSM